MPEKISLVAVLPDGREYFDDVSPFVPGAKIAASDYEWFAQAAVRANYSRAGRGEDTCVPVRVFRLELCKGQLIRHIIKTVLVERTTVPMDPGEYEHEMEQILEALPPAFRGWVASCAYERGHSAGFEEVLMLAREMADGLAQCLKEHGQG